MKIFKTAVLAALMVSGVGVAAHAAVLIPTAEVSPINTLVFAAQTLAIPSYLNATAVTAAHIGNVTIDNNDPDGFKITMSSAKAGKLTRYNTATSAYSASGVVGNEVSYTITMAPVSGTLGTAEPAAFVAADIALTAATEYNFDSSITRATVAKLYSMKVKVNGGTMPDFLLNSEDADVVYRDTITVTLANL